MLAKVEAVTIQLIVIKIMKIIFNILYLAIFKNDLEKIKTDIHPIPKIKGILCFSIVGKYDHIK